MLLWILILIATALVGVIVWSIVAMDRAERRARRGLYRGLGLSEPTVDFLMERNRDVLAELSFLRRQGDAAEDLVLATPPSRPNRWPPHLRLVETLRDQGRFGPRDAAAPGDLAGGSDDNTPATPH